MNSRWPVFSALIIIFLVVIIEASSAVGLFALKRWKGLEYIPREVKVAGLATQISASIKSYFLRGLEGKIRFDPDLGWTLCSEYHTPWEDITNGIRDNRTYSKDKTFTGLRILSFGDSFTYGSGVSNRSAWQFFMNQSKELEVLNFGVPGYGLDQSLWRYQKEGRQYQADIVLIGYMPENIGRNVNIFRPLYNGDDWPFTKPRFVENIDGLKKIENPLKSELDLQVFMRSPEALIKKIGGSDYYYRHYYTAGWFDFFAVARLWKVLKFSHFSEYNGLVSGSGIYAESSEAFRVTTKIFDTFVSNIRESGSLPVIVVLPNEVDLRAARLGKPKRYQCLLEDFKRKGYYHVDAQDAFSKYYSDVDMKDLIRFHYSPRGNEAVARAVSEYLAALLRR